MVHAFTYSVLSILAYPRKTFKTGSNTDYQFYILGLIAANKQQFIQHIVLKNSIFYINIVNMLYLRYYMIMSIYRV